MDFDPLDFTERLVKRAGRLGQADKDAIVTGLGIALFVGVCLFWYFAF